jgi:hypothetical protein
LEDLSAAKAKAPVATMIKAEMITAIPFRDVILFSPFVLAGSC